MKTQIKRIGKNTVKVGKINYSLKQFKEAEKETNKILNEDLDYLKI